MTLERLRNQKKVRMEVYPTLKHWTNTGKRNCTDICTYTQVPC